jgi:hypothetical protein
MGVRFISQGTVKVAWEGDLLRGFGMEQKRGEKGEIG